MSLTYTVRDPPTKLIMDREYSNTHDKNACFVWVPPLDDFPSIIYVYEKRQLKFGDIADLPIGHVPNCLSKFIRSVLDEDGTVCHCHW